MEWIRDVGNVFSIERNLISFRQLVHMDIPVFKQLVSFLLSDDIPRQKQPSILKAKYGDARYGSRNVEMIVLCWSFVFNIIMYNHDIGDDYLCTI